MGKKEVWLRGETTKNITPLLQPPVNTLLEAREEIIDLVGDFSDDLLWEKPGGVASVGFHLQHIPGVLDRLLTYAEGKQLNEQQLEYLRQEQLTSSASTHVLRLRVEQAVGAAIERMKNFSADSLLEHRGVGRMELPSTVIGLCFHAAEHTMRHTGQLLVTSRILRTKQ
jgi:uncharacterized damage-inducible protein DinB